MGTIEANIELLRPRLVGTSGQRYTELCLGIQLDAVHLSTVRLTLAFAREIVSLARSRDVEAFASALADVRSLEDKPFGHYVNALSVRKNVSPMYYYEKIHAYLKSDIIRLEDYVEPEWLEKSRLFPANRYIPDSVV